MDTFVITGANRGIGLETVRQLLQTTDHRVVATARQPGVGVLQDLQNRYPNRLKVVPLEVTNQASIAAAMAAIAAFSETVDVLINNAGIDPPGQDFGEMDADLMLHILSVNTVAPMMIAQAAYPLLKRSPAPRIVHISSSMGSLADRTYGGSYGYCSSKAGLNMLMRGMAADLGKEGFICIALDPGWVRTDMGGAQASLSPLESATGIINVITNLRSADNGRYLVWDGSTNNW